MPALSPDRTPVIVGIGEVIDRPRDLQLALEPVALMANAIERAASDATDMNAAALLRSVDSIDVVAEYSWPYAEPLALLSARLGVSPRRQAYGKAGGESPVRFIHEAARRIANGESTVCAVVGAEAAHSAAAAAKTGVSFPWAPRDPHAKLVRGKDLCHPVAVAHGMMQPVQIYPLYENAATAAWGQTPAQGRRESAELWSRYSDVAVANPYSWLQQRFTAEQIATSDADNRPIAWPYTKHMVANPFVNQGAAVIVTSLTRARELGIAPQRHTYVWSGASANEPADYLQRDQYQHSVAQDTVLDSVLEHAGGDVSRFALVELYSCFPIVPKMARRRLGMSADAQMTSTGGLSFFGAPLNNYMTHAAAGLVRELRKQPGKLALLYGQGEYVTKHHALILSTFAADEDRLTADGSVQAAADRHRGSVPALVEHHDGAAHVETFTVVYDRSGAAEFGTVIGRTQAGERLMARVRADDARTLALLTDLDVSPIGMPGTVRRGDDGLLTWKAT